MSAHDDDLSLAAAIFLIAIDPQRGRLVKRRRRRFRKALAGAHGTGATRARRAAVRELWCGVLQRRLTRSERKAVAKRLKTVLLDQETEGAREHGIDETAWALGRVAYGEQMDIVQEAIGDLLSGDTVTIDVGGGSGGDGGGGGGDGGGGGGGGGGD